MATNSDNVTAKLRKLSKEELIWCILKFEKLSLGWPSLNAILADLKFKKDMDKIDRCDMLAKKAHDKRMEYCELLRENTGGRRMSNELTYMDCWHFIAPLIPVDTNYTIDIYVMVFNALKEAEKKRIAEKKKGGKATQ